MIVRGESTIIDYNAPFDQGLTIGVAKAFVGIMFVVFAKSGKNVLVINENGRCNE